MPTAPPPATAAPTTPDPASTSASRSPPSPRAAATTPTTGAAPLARPTPERLQPGGPPRDPGPLDWAHPGPYLGPGFASAPAPVSFRADQPLIATYYFYWDDLTDPAHRDRDRALRPPDQEHYSFLNPDTHRRQFEDMQRAGVDLALAVYWGEPGHPGRTTPSIPGHDWSTEGIPPMVAALDRLAAAGRPFKLGLFLDTTIMANADLTTPNGKAYLYVNVRDFYSRVPPRHWAAIGGKPVVWLYDVQWVSRFDQSTFDDLADRFARDFGGLRPYVVRELQWYQSKGVDPAQVIQTDNVYGWGAALSGYNPDGRLGVAEVGPGFGPTDSCRRQGGAGCLLADRRGGARYAEQLAAALRSGRRIIAIETWNEFDESTGIAETVELGRTYIDLTREYADAFHAGRRGL
jgi:hypothetical protein